MLKPNIAVLLCGALLLPAMAAGQSDAYPQKAIRLITPFPPGGSVDVIGRLIAPKLSESLGKQVVVDNRVGASGNIGTELAARAPADGYTPGAGECQTRHAELRHGRHRHQSAHRRRVLQLSGQVQHRRRALQGRRTEPDRRHER
ncbi:MAG: hypothetical protein EBT83_01040 [Betaproteobacteria bacterium]|nr:hypothetical protein [Betaproteobacteria bacterium]